MLKTATGGLVEALAVQAKNLAAVLAAQISSLGVEAQQEIDQIKKEREAQEKAFEATFLPGIRSTIGGALAPLLFGPFGPGNVQRDILNENKKTNTILEKIERKPAGGFAFAAG